MYSILMSKKPATEKQAPQRQKLDQMSQGQRERLCFIDFNLLFLGGMGRVEHAAKFDVASAVFTRDMALYRELAPENLVFNDKQKRYDVTSAFKPIFEHDVHRSLFALTRGFGQGLNQASEGYLPAEFPLRLNQPTVDVLALISRAIHQKKAVHVVYHSFTSGATERVLVPSAIVDSGTRWHIRAYDRNKSQFRDFTINRINDPILVDEVVKDIERQQHDHQWLRMLTVELVPHPAAERPEIIKLDYAMKGGTLVLNLRAAVAGYVLQQWNVDCSADYHLDPVRHRLWLKNADKVLYGVESAVMAPGYRSQSVATYK